MGRDPHLRTRPIRVHYTKRTRFVPRTLPTCTYSPRHTRFNLTHDCTYIRFNVYPLLFLLHAHDAYRITRRGTRLNIVYPFIQCVPVAFSTVCTRLHEEVHGYTVCTRLDVVVEHAVEREELLVERGEHVVGVRGLEAAQSFQVHQGQFSKSRYLRQKCVEYCDIALQRRVVGLDLMPHGSHRHVE